MNREETMRKSLGTALLLGFATIAAPAFAQTAAPQDVRVTVVDRANKGFSAQWYTGTANYVTNGRTAIIVGGAPTSFDYIKAGLMVRVSAHPEGSNMVADQVVVIQ
jgi:hypothetical protein